MSVSVREREIEKRDRRGQRERREEEIREVRCKQNNYAKWVSQRLEPGDYCRGEVALIAVRITFMR